MKKTLKVIGLFALMIANIPQNFACTNFLVSKGASKTGATYITYSADSHTLYGELYYRPAADYAPGTFLDIREWDTGKPLGKIAQATHTYSVVGNMNENQVTIGETTYTGREELADSTAIMDYGSLIYVTLQRAKTAREAIKIMGELVSQYGYYSTGESFSIGDPNEVWILEMIGKGAPAKVKDKKGVEKVVYSKGAVWVAIRIPEGYISGHANHARITSFPLANGKTSITFKNIKDINKPEIACVYADDVIDFAKEKGYYKKDSKVPFSFADAYAPMDFGGLRACEARVWAGFRKVCKEADKYFPYIDGRDMINRLPLYMKPDEKVSFEDVKNMMRDHYTGTQFDMTQDVGAGPYNCPYRWRPMTWSIINGKDTANYVHERAISTQQTGFSFITEARSWLPNHIGGINWFGVDDTYLTVYTPMYCGITSVPKSFAVGTGSMTKFSWESAFWVFNFVSNWTYTRWSDMIVDVQKEQKLIEDMFAKGTAHIELKIAELVKTRPNDVDKVLTDYSNQQGDFVTARWRKLGEYLLVKYMDGNVKPDKDKVFIENGHGQPVQPGHPAYPDEWYRRIAKDRGAILQVRPLPKIEN